VPASAGRLTRTLGPTFARSSSSTYLLMRLKLLAFLLAATSPCTSFAQATPASAASSASAAPAQSNAPIRVRTITYLSTESEYPLELSSKGVQGKTDVTVSVGPDGSPSSLLVTATSRSKELDDAAVKAVSVLKFNRKPGDTKDLPPIIVPVEFKRDSLQTLAKKTCTEFNVDAEYFRATFPERDPSKMEVIAATIGALVLATSSQDPGGIVSTSKRATAASKQIAAACLENPSALYIQMFRELMSKSGA
jgi:TonB family protein